jgi:hypothetical protein
MVHQYLISAYVNYKDYKSLERGQYVRIYLNERHLPSEVLGQIILNDPASGGRQFPPIIRFVKYWSEFDDDFMLIMLCGGEGTSDATIELLDEMQYQLLTS